MKKAKKNTVFGPITVKKGSPKAFERPKGAGTRSAIPGREDSLQHVEVLPIFAYRNDKLRPLGETTSSLVSEDAASEFNGNEHLGGWEKTAE